MQSSNQLSLTRLGRILLHLRCAWARPSHWRWHWQGIQRELPPLLVVHCHSTVPQSLTSTKN